MNHSAIFKGRAIIDFALSAGSVCVPWIYWATQHNQSIKTTWPSLHV
jgi:hypothetical protein